jgi:peptide/nickel transport system permease protein
MTQVMRHATMPVLFGVGLILLALCPVLIGRLFVGPEMAEVFSAIPNLRPGLEHPLGTQSEGRDLLAVIMLGTPATLAVGLIGGGIAVIVGGLLGFTAGYFGGRIDAVIRIIVDIGLTIPPLAILIMIAASYPIASVPLMGLIIAATQWMWATRIIRAQVLTLREREFVRMAKLSGVSDFGIILFELAPNLIPFIAASFVNAVTTAILASIGLEVLGLGPRQSYTLGNTIYEATYYTAMWRGMWWWWGPPIVILISVFVGLFLISNVLDRIANPKLDRGF